MLPTFDLGPWSINTYGLFALLGLLVSGMYALHRLLRLDYPRGVILGGMFLTIVAGLLSTFLMSWLLTLFSFARSGFLARPEGISIIWALAGGLLAATVYIWKQGASLGYVLDLVAPPVALGLAIGRLGCASAGCCYGRPTDSWLGVYLPDEQGFWQVRYPTQLMSAAVDLTIFVTLLLVERYGRRWVGPDRTWPFNGFLTLLGLTLFGLKRFVMGFLRESGPPLLGPLSWMHLSALLIIGGCSLLLVWNLRHRGQDSDRKTPGVS